MRIAHVIAPGGVGGAENVVAALASGAQHRGLGVDVISLRQDPDPGPLVEAVRALGVNVIEIWCGRRRYLREMTVLASTLHQIDADIVHSHGYHGNVVGHFAARRAGVPIVTTAHGFTGGGVRNRVYEWIDVEIVKRMDAVVCVSPLIRDRLVRAGVRSDKLHHVANGHDGSIPLERAEARARLALPDSRPIIGWIGRVSPEKGPDRFVEAIAELRGAALGVMIGDGPVLADLRRAAAEQDVPIIFTGERPGAGQLITAFDVLAMTSRTEGLPMTALHAMNAGIPVVATAVGALPEVLADEAGWIATGNAPAIARAIAEALADPTEARRRAAKARQRLDSDYSRDAWLNRMERVYHAVLDKVSTAKV